MVAYEARRRVLVVDDDPAMCALLRDYLVGADYHPLLVGRATDALQLLCSDEIPLVVTDWLMPEVSGVELCRLIRAHEGINMVYLIMLTVQDREQHVVEALDAGADDYLVKPVRRDELLARVRVGFRTLDMHADLAGRIREFCRHNARLASLTEKLTTLAARDELTGLLNRREVLAQLEGCWAIAHVQREPLACVMLDIDHFKQINDSHGHPAGDLVLAATARRLREVCRASDLAARVGGEEFLVVCPRTSLEQAMCLAERVRAATARPVAVGDDLLEVTVSVGVAEADLGMRGPADLLRAADEALYAAKRAGRNRVLSY